MVMVGAYIMITHLWVVVVVVFLDNVVDNNNDNDNDNSMLLPFL